MLRYNYNFKILRKYEMLPLKFNQGIVKVEFQLKQLMLKV